MYPGKTIQFIQKSAMMYVGMNEWNKLFSNGKEYFLLWINKRFCPLEVQNVSTTSGQIRVASVVSF